VILDLLHGDIPALNGVTLRTVCAHPSLVHVGMTVLAILPHVCEHRLYVALRALHFVVHTAQRIPGLVVIEFRIRLDRAPRAHLVAIFARDGERRPMRIARSRPVLLMGTLGSLGGLPTRCRRAPHPGEGQQSAQNDPEHCRRKFPLLGRAFNSPAGKGPLKLPALCADSRGEATVRTVSSGPGGLLYRGAVRQWPKGLLRRPSLATTRKYGCGMNRLRSEQITHAERLIENGTASSPSVEGNFC
jgi:hypothetical protein